MTDRELQEYLGKSDANEVRPRRNELFKALKVKEFPKRKCRVTGKTVIVWGLNDNPPVQLEMFAA